MLPTNKGRIAHLGSVELESRIIAEFNRIYFAEGQPERMALFSHYVDEHEKALSITPESVPYCASLFSIAEWSNYDRKWPFGAVGWEAGDQRLRSLASTVFVSM